STHSGACRGGQTGRSASGPEVLQIQYSRPGGFGQTQALPIINEVLSSTGQSLDTAARNFMERRFGQDFGNVRVHTDAKAAMSARVIGAGGYTVGANIVFGAGRFRPETQQGRQLIAHELTHVWQQQSRSFVARKEDDLPDQGRSFAQILSDFNWQRYRGGPTGMGDVEKAKPLARQL